MAVQAVIRNVTGGADKPFGPRIVPLKHLAPRREPLQLFGGMTPKGFGIRDRFLVLGFVVFDIGCSYCLGGWLVGSAFL